MKLFIPGDSVSLNMVDTTWFILILIVDTTTISTVRIIGIASILNATTIVPT